MESFKVVCINDNARPLKYNGQWIEKGEIYTVIDAKYLAQQRMAVGYKLEEIDMPSDSPYQYFLANRFRPLTEDDMEAEAALEELMQEVYDESYA
jgi:hypothetical protein